MQLPKRVPENNPHRVLPEVPLERRRAGVAKQDEEVEEAAVETACLCVKFVWRQDICQTKSTKGVTWEGPLSIMNLLWNAFASDYVF